METLHFSDIAEHHGFLGLPAPEHPLLAVSPISLNVKNVQLSCLDRDLIITTDFYSISLKHFISGEVFYGRTKYDFKNGVMIFVSPRQEIRTKGVKVESQGKLICFHEDFIRSHQLKERIKKYNFFNYSVNEALHLSPKEERLIMSIFDNIEQEYHGNFDEHSKEIILAQLDTLLRYAERFYCRQFQQRKEASNSTKDRFIEEFEQLSTEGIPTVEDIANQMNMTPRYLSDALKVETGKTAIEILHLHLIDKAKDLLLGSDTTVARVAYDLGFAYPQYFSRLFKKKVGMTPTEYRKHVHQ